MQNTIEFGTLHAGPPFAVNGGHLAGVMAERAGLPGAHVELRAPVPFDSTVEIDASDDGVTLRHLGTTLATASPVSLLDMSNPGVDLATALAAMERVDVSRHPFPGCYVCGPDRSPDDGLHVLPGEVSPGLFATVWEPTARQAHGCGSVPLRVVTAVLDCPSAFAILEEGDAALLASMTFSVRRLPRVGERMVVSGVAGRIAGRKRWATTTITSTSGETVAKANNLWITVAAAQLASMQARTMEMAA